MIGGLCSRRRAEHISFLFGNLGVPWCLPTSDRAVSLVVGGDSLGTVLVVPSTPRRALERGPQLLPSADRAKPRPVGRDDPLTMLSSRLRTVRLLSVRALVLGALLTSLLLLAMPQRAFAATVSDDFNRANGSLGADWTDMSAGGLAISNDAVVGTNETGNSGDIYTGEAFGSDQFSQIELTSTQLSGGQWVGPAVRAQDGGQDLYVGIYFWNNGYPELMLFKLLNGNWTELGSVYATPALPAGTLLNLTVTGSTLSFSENGAVEITATDTSLTGGAPAIMAYGTPTAGNWSGGDATTGGTYSIGGSVSGLSGTVVLENNGGNNLSVSANGTFTFSSLVAQSAPYDVTVQSDPSGQACTVANGSGTVGSANVTNVSVTCVAAGTGGPYSIGGSVSGLSGTVVLENNGGNNLSVSANGTFTFSSPWPRAPPTTSPCRAILPVRSAPSPTDPGTVGSANVTNVSVTCVDRGGWWPRLG